MTHPLINDMAATWLSAARADTKPKGKGYLRAANGCTCMLGDAVLLAYPEDSPLWSADHDDIAYNLTVDGDVVFNMLPEQLVKDLGLFDQAGGARYDAEDRRSIWSLNDCTSKTKAEIADLIEANPEVYFKPLEERA